MGIMGVISVVVIIVHTHPQTRYGKNRGRKGEWVSQVCSVSTFIYLIGYIVM